VSTDLSPWVLDQRVQVGRRIRALRTERGWSQERLADAAGLGRHSIYRTELGTHSASLDAIVMIAHALGVPSWRLLRDE
jgi:transcriptional regulator with XRE-family HTH domain